MKWHTMGKGWFKGKRETWGGGRNGFRGFTDEKNANKVQSFLEGMNITH